jgi:hypothetical protein
MTPRTRRAPLVLACLLAATTAACTTTVDGTPAPKASPAGATRVDDAPGAVVAPPPAGPGRYAEARRLAGATALVQTSFPDRTTACFPQDEVVDARALTERYWPGTNAEQYLERYGFVAGWGECASGAGLGTITLSIELSDPAAAVAATRDLAAAVRTPADRPATVLNGATALVSTGATTDTAQVWIAVGRTVAYVHHEAPAGEGLDGAARVATDQVRLLAGFTPTPQPDVPGLPRDPNGLRELAVDPPGAAGLADGAYDLESYLRVSSHPTVERELLTANGFVGAYSKIAMAGTLSYSVALYAFPTSEQTNAVYDVFATEEVELFGGTRFTLPSVPDAPCVVFPDGAPGAAASFTQLCYVGHGGHLAGVAVSGLAAPDDLGPMDRLLPAQRALIAG